MKYVIDINHPAHVHYFKNFASIMRQKGHSVIFVSRERYPAFDLLNSLGEKYVNRGRGSNSMLGKLLYFVKANLKYIKIALMERPDIYISFVSPYPHQIARLFHKTSIAFNDTEHAVLHKKVTYPFTDCILTPSCFYDELGEKQIRFDSLMELAYLHPSRFTPNKNVLKEIGVGGNERFVLLRFVSWGAHHDVGQSGMTDELKYELIKKFEAENFRVFISSEKQLPTDLKKYELSISPEKMHDVLAFASLFVGESGTMASECAVLGTPAVYINSLPLMGYLKEEEKAGLLFHFSRSGGVFDKVCELIDMPDLKQNFREKRNQFIKNKLDLTAFMVWFIENSPESARIMKETPEYQNRFK